MTQPIRHRVLRPNARGSIAGRDFGRVSFVETEYAPRLRMGRHADAETRITLVLAGGGTETAGRCEHPCGPGSVVFKPAGADHANDFGDGGMTTFGIRFAASIAAPNAYRWLHGGPIASRMMRLYEVFAGDGDIEAETLDAELLDLLAPLTPAASDEPTGHLPPWLDGVRDRLHEDYREPVRVRDLAGMVDTHPVYLARVFRRRFGCSVIAYVHRLRVRYAGDRLRSSEDPPAQIAFDTGFADQAHFCRVFKAHTGLSPGAYRRLIRGG
jgi:AraC family transcriptional regulator